MWTYKRNEHEPLEYYGLKSYVLSRDEKRIAVITEESDAKVYTDAKVSAWFSHPKACPKPVLIEWTFDMAKRIGLANKDNWRNYPRAMLRSRVVGEGVRATYPGVAVGLYTIDEAIDEVHEKNITPSAGAVDTLTEERRVQIYDLAEKVREWLNSGSLTDAYLEIENANLENEEYIFLWTHFDSRTRRQLKEEGERQAIKLKALENKAVISDAQKKRLEARIGEHKLDREAVKVFCSANFNKEHFADLTHAEYDIVDKQIDEWAAGGASPSGALPSASGTASAPTGTADEALLIRAREFAELGSARYEKHWLGLTPVQRKAIGAERHERFKEIAAKVPA